MSNFKQYIYSPIYFLWWRDAVRSASQEKFEYTLNILDKFRKAGVNWVDVVLLRAFCFSCLLKNEEAESEFVRAIEILTNRDPLDDEDRYLLAYASNQMHVVTKDPNWAGRRDNYFKQVNLSQVGNNLRETFPISDLNSRIPL